MNEQMFRDCILVPGGGKGLYCFGGQDGPVTDPETRKAYPSAREVLQAVIILGAYAVLVDDVAYVSCKPEKLPAGAVGCSVWTYRDDAEDIARQVRGRTVSMMELYRIYRRNKAVLRQP